MPHTTLVNFIDHEELAVAQQKYAPYAYAGLSITEAIKLRNLDASLDPSHFEQLLGGFGVTEESLRLNIGFVELQSLDSSKLMKLLVSLGATAEDCQKVAAEIDLLKSAYDKFEKQLIKLGITAKNRQRIIKVIAKSQAQNEDFSEVEEYQNILAITYAHHQRSKLELAFIDLFQPYNDDATKDNVFGTQEYTDLIQAIKNTLQKLRVTDAQDAMDDIVLGLKTQKTYGAIKLYFEDYILPQIKLFELKKAFAGRFQQIQRDHVAVTEAGLESAVSRLGTTYELDSFDHYQQWLSGLGFEASTANYVCKSELESGSTHFFASYSDATLSDANDFQPPLVGDGALKPTTFNFKVADGAVKFNFERKILDPHSIAIPDAVQVHDKLSFSITNTTSVKPEDIQVKVESGEQHIHDPAVHATYSKYRANQAAERIRSDQRLLANHTLNIQGHINHCLDTNGAIKKTAMDGLNANSQLLLMLQHSRHVDDLLSNKLVKPLLAFFGRSTETIVKDLLLVQQCHDTSSHIKQKTQVYLNNYKLVDSLHKPDAALLLEISQKLKEPATRKIMLNCLLAVKNEDTIKILMQEKGIRNFLSRTVLTHFACQSSKAVAVDMLKPSPLERLVFAVKSYFNKTETHEKPPYKRFTKYSSSNSAALKRITVKHPSLLDAELSSENYIHYRKRLEPKEARELVTNSGKLDKSANVILDESYQKAVSVMRTDREFFEKANQYKPFTTQDHQQYFIENRELTLEDYAGLQYATTWTSFHVDLSDSELKTLYKQKLLQLHAQTGNGLLSVIEDLWSGKPKEKTNFLWTSKVPPTKLQLVKDTVLQVMESLTVDTNTLVLSGSAPLKIKVADVYLLRLAESYTKDFSETGLKELQQALLGNNETLDRLFKPVVMNEQQKNGLVEQILVDDENQNHPLTYILNDSIFQQLVKASPALYTALKELLDDSRLKSMRKESGFLALYGKLFAHKPTFKQGLQEFEVLQSLLKDKNLAQRLHEVPLLMDYLASLQTGHQFLALLGNNDIFLKMVWAQAAKVADGSPSDSEREQARTHILRVLTLLNREKLVTWLNNDPSFSAVIIKCLISSRNFYEAFISVQSDEILRTLLNNADQEQQLQLMLHCPEFRALQIARWEKNAGSNTKENLIDFIASCDETALVQIIDGHPKLLTVLDRANLFKKSDVRTDKGKEKEIPAKEIKVAQKLTRIVEKLFHHQIQVEALGKIEICNQQIQALQSHAKTTRTQALTLGQSDVNSLDAVEALLDAGIDNDDLGLLIQSQDFVNALSSDLKQLLSLLDKLSKRDSKFTRLLVDALLQKSLVDPEFKFVTNDKTLINFITQFASVNLLLQFVAQYKVKINEWQLGLDRITKSDLIQFKNALPALKLRDDFAKWAFNYVACNTQGITLVDLGLTSQLLETVLQKKDCNLVSIVAFMAKSSENSGALTRVLDENKAAFAGFCSAVLADPNNILGFFNEVSPTSKATSKAVARMLSAPFINALLENVSSKTLDELVGMFKDPLQANIITALSNMLTRADVREKIWQAPRAARKVLEYIVESRPELWVDIFENYNVAIDEKFDVSLLEKLASKIDNTISSPVLAQLFLLSFELKSSSQVAETIFQKIWTVKETMLSLYQNADPVTLQECLLIILTENMPLSSNGKDYREIFARMIGEKCLPLLDPNKVLELLWAVYKTKSEFVTFKALVADFLDPVLLAADTDHLIYVLLQGKGGDLLLADAFVEKMHNDEFANRLKERFYKNGKDYTLGKLIIHCCSSKGLLRLFEVARQDSKFHSFVINAIVTTPDIIASKDSDMERYNICHDFLMEKGSYKDIISIAKAFDATAKQFKPKKNLVLAKLIESCQKNPVTAEFDKVVGVACSKEAEQYFFDRLVEYYPKWHEIVLKKNNADSSEAKLDEAFIKHAVGRCYKDGKPSGDQWFLNLFPNDLTFSVYFKQSNQKFMIYKLLNECYPSSKLTKSLDLLLADSAFVSFVDTLEPKALVDVFNIESAKKYKPLTKHILQSKSPDLVEKLFGNTLGITPLALQSPEMHLALKLIDLIGLSPEEKSLTTNASKLRLKTFLSHFMVSGREIKTKNGEPTSVEQRLLYLYALRENFDLSSRDPNQDNHVNINNFITKVRNFTSLDEKGLSFSATKEVIPLKYAFKFFLALLRFFSISNPSLNIVKEIDDNAHLRKLLRSAVQFDNDGSIFYTNEVSYIGEVPAEYRTALLYAHQDEEKPNRNFYKALLNSVEFKGDKLFYAGLPTDKSGRHNIPVTYQKMLQQAVDNIGATLFDKLHNSSVNIDLTPHQYSVLGQLILDQIEISDDGRIVYIKNKAVVPKSYVLIAMDQLRQHIQKDNDCLENPRILALVGKLPDLKALVLDPELHLKSRLLNMVRYVEVGNIVFGDSSSNTPVAPKFLALVLERVITLLGKDKDKGEGKGKGKESDDKSSSSNVLGNQPKLQQALTTISRDMEPSVEKIQVSLKLPTKVKKASGVSIADWAAKGNSGIAPRRRKQVVDVGSNSAPQKGETHSAH